MRNMRIDALLTSGRRDERVGLNMNASSWVVRRQLEVADRHARKAIERLERDVLAKLNAVEDGPECGEAERVGRDRPLEVWIVKEEGCETRGLVLVRVRQPRARLVVGDAVVGSCADWRQCDRGDIVTLPGDAAQD